jgi:YVTN family beta-propeller protein
MRTARLTASLGAALAGTVFTAKEVSNTVSVPDTGTRKLAATVDLGDENHHRPLYNGIVDAHGPDLSPDGRLLAVTVRGSSNVVFVDTGSRGVVADVLVGREPPVPTFTPDGKEAWAPCAGGTPSR